jgi:hypothetical protein
MKLVELKALMRASILGGILARCDRESPRWEQAHEEAEKEVDVILRELGLE